MNAILSYMQENQNANGYVNQHVKLFVYKIAAWLWHLI